MCSAPRRFTGFFAVLVIGMFAIGAEPIEPPAQGVRGADITHIREELGVNQFTAPSIAGIFAELGTLGPFSFDKTWRDLPDTTPHSRAGLALATGQLIASGFLVVAAEKQSRLEPVGRLLLKYAKGLGIGERVTRHSRSIIELAARQRWGDVERELVKAQVEVEAGMMALKDEEIAHLVSLGGWLRGLEIASTAVAETYTPQRALRLTQPELFEYFTERITTLQPALRSTPLIQLLEKNLSSARELIQKSKGEALSAEHVKDLRDYARVMNKAIATPDP